MKKYFVALKNGYSLVNEEILKTIPKSIIVKKKEIEDRLYTKDELNKLDKEVRI